jgi:benzoyl-CoA reductase subunit C
MNGKGPKSVGYACSYVPEEVIMAAGFDPQRIIPKGRSSHAEGLIHSNTCFYVKSLLADVMDGEFSHMGAVIVANSCDAMKRLSDIWGAYVKQPIALFMDVPKKKNPDAVSLLASELRKLALSLSSLPGGRGVTVDDLNYAIGQVNGLRSSWLKLFDAQKNPQSCIRGSDIFALLLDGSSLDPVRFKERIDAFMQEHVGEPLNKKKKIIITGNILNSPGLVSMIEDAGGSVAGIDTCFGKQHYELMVKENTADPFEALAQRYLYRPSCPRMMDMEDQNEYLKKSLEDTDADGVIVSQVKFCDSLICTIPSFRETAGSAGINLLVLENDYEWSDREKTRIKVEAFLEMLG